VSVKKVSGTFSQKLNESGIFQKRFLTPFLDGHRHAAGIWFVAQRGAGTIRCVHKCLIEKWLRCGDRPCPSFAPPGDYAPIASRNLEEPDQKKGVRNLFAETQ
jgi:hypothetical protein